jgi:NAD(P)-dependent dehydrogenase (short-subunit alcohol dehydrogenase family)
MGMLEGKVAIVLGASTRGGIGATSARKFATEGATVVLSARRRERAEELAREIGGTAMRCDATDERDVAALVADARAQHGRVDIAMIVAGGHASQPLDAIEAETLRRLFEINVVGPALFIKHSARAMDRGGSIIVVSSHSAQLTTVGIGPYACTKASVERLVEVAAFEYGAKGIKVNTLSPSILSTPMSDPILQRPGVQRGYERETPMGRLATVNEVAAAALWLASDECFTTGDRIRVGGGIHLRRFPLAEECRED